MPHSCIRKTVWIRVGRKEIMFYWHNEAAIHITNRGRSQAQPTMKLMRRLIWCVAKGNFIIIDKYTYNISSKY